MTRFLFFIYVERTKTRLKACKKQNGGSGEYDASDIDVYHDYGAKTLQIINESAQSVSKGGSKGIYSKII